MQTMLPRARLLLVALGVTLTMATGGLVASAPAAYADGADSTPSTLEYGDDMVAVPAAASVAAKRSATAPETLSAAAAPSTVHEIWVSVDSTTTTTADDSVSVPADQAAAAAFVAQLSDYWSRETGGAVSLVLGGFEVRAVTATCSISGVYSAARSADFNGKFSTTNKWAGTNRHLLAIPREDCTSDTVGQGTVGGNGGIIVSGVGTSATIGVAVSAHEFGHNLGFLHANAVTCPAGVDSGSSCSEAPYGDFLDVMGYAVDGSLPHVSTPQLIKLGYLTAYARLSKTTGVVTQTLSTTGTRAVTITDPGTGEVYYVEYRAGDAQDATSLEFDPGRFCSVSSSGLMRCVGGADPSVGTVRVMLLDSDGTWVETVGPNSATYLNAGQSFTNHDSNFRVTVSSLSGTAGASLSIAFGSSITTAPVQTTTPATSAPTTTTIPPTTVTTETPTTATGTGTGTGTGTAATGSTTATTTPSTTSTTTSVAPRTTLVRSHTRVYLTHKSIAKGARPRVTVVITGPHRPTGTVAIYANGKKIATTKLRYADAGVRSIKLPARSKAGKVSITARFVGNATAKPSASVVKKLTVRK